MNKNNEDHDVKRGPFIRMLYYLGAGLWVLFAVVSLCLIFIPDDQGLTGNPVLDFRVSAGSILMGTIRPLAFLSSALVCLGVGAWLFVTGMIREEGSGPP